jgi:hypothetical protein
MSEAASMVFIGSCLFVAAFQVLLVLGRPWGEWTLGGRFRGRLPPLARGVAGCSALLLAGFAVVAAARAELAFPGLRVASGWLIWVVVAYCAVGTVMNGITPSVRERRLWLPVVAVMLITSVLVAVS